MQHILKMIEDERNRQLSLDYSELHDDEHKNGEIALAAAHYANPDQNMSVSSWAHGKDKDDRITQLVKAGALIVAEIERFERLIHQFKE